MIGNDQLTSTNQLLERANKPFSSSSFDNNTATQVEKNNTTADMKNNHQPTRGFSLVDGLEFMRFGAQAVAQDEFSKCFTQKKRTNMLKMHSLKAFIHFIDVSVRYLVVFPLRMLFLLSCTILFLLLIPPVNYFKWEKGQHTLFKYYCNVFLISWGSRIKFHGPKPDMKKIPHIYVANHTSFIDFLVLSAYQFPHATISQTHGGIMGFFQKSVLALNGSLSFNRNEKNDRTVICKKMKEHTSDTLKSPLLIFPEGTCVNNEYTVLFHKGAFELDCAVVPVAIKYNKSYGDVYWSTKTQSFSQHLLYLMTRWALVADVWFLEPETLLKGKETSADFAGRVKAKISTRAGLKNLSWDGYFKNYAPAEAKQKKMVQGSQSEFASGLFKRIASSHDISSMVQKQQPNSRVSVIGSSSATSSSDTSPSKRRVSFGPLSTIEDLSKQSDDRGTKLKKATRRSKSVDEGLSIPTSPKRSLLPSKTVSGPSALSPMTPLTLKSKSSQYSSSESNDDFPVSNKTQQTTTVTSNGKAPDLQTLFQSTNIKNDILVAVEEQDCRAEMIKCISDQKNNVVSMWKKYTKIRDEDNVKRRVEYSSWRVWFKQRNESQVQNGVHFSQQDLVDIVGEEIGLLKSSTKRPTNNGSCLKHKSSNGSINTTDNDLVYRLAAFTEPATLKSNSDGGTSGDTHLAAYDDSIIMTAASTPGGGGGSADDDDNSGLRCRKNTGIHSELGH